MSTDNHPLWQCYQQTQFLFTQSLSPTLSFAIITAHNPQGEILSASQNRLLDRKLQGEIEKMGLPYRAMVGTSSDRRHMEKSWAVAIDKPAAIALGLAFKQNAIYFVENDTLRLVPCLLKHDETAIGRFSSRVNLVSELPESC
ncbi:MULTISPECIES: DUF3293 domain-containing protein [Shewanella]|uniref:DUF3293 domain-containing protein n=1 Tax=Shewanella TaxID=22 RepID=UPI0004906AB2|nr:MULTISPECIES: DUF3293 domain-containing protein [Shewanella]QLE84267.1 DUF3293 domain-containing protein [Shewanella sp. Scap07]